MTFQLLSTIQIGIQHIEREKRGIESDSGCKYLEDLITTVHIIQLKALTCIGRSKTKKSILIYLQLINYS